ncbi:MAG: hypothetical protein U0K18_06075 [Acutalibacteraceae bacterium]|nr:hypothetical protein [Acutalibacteraceae bacterium]
MVKGVSKTVIVVNNTGSKLFEKIVFYVTPEYGTLSAKQLKKAASSFSFNYDHSLKRNNLRAAIKRKKRIRLIAVSFAFVVAAAVTLAIIL